MTKSIQDEVLDGLAPTQPRTWTTLRTDSRRTSVAAVVVGAASLALTMVGGPVLIIRGNVLSPEAITSTLESRGMAWLLLAGVFTGLIAIGIAVGRYRAMDTRVAQKQSIVAGVLGAQGIAAGIIAFSFIQLGDLEAFTRNFLNFEQVYAWRDAFVSGAGTTLKISFMSLALGLILGLIVSVFLISEHSVVRAPARVYVNVFRGTPFLVQLSVIYFGLAIGMGIQLSPELALTVTVALEASGYMAEVFRGGIQSIPRGQLDAARGLGLGYMASLRYVLIPQAGRSVIPPLMNDFITIIKDTSFLIFVGVSYESRDMFSVASQGYNQYYNSSFYMAAGCGYLAITLPLIWLVNTLESRVRAGQSSAAR